MNKVIAAFANNGTRATTQTALWQYDYGQILVIQGVQLPTAYEVHFCNSKDSTTITAIGNAEGVTIPDQFLKNGETIYAYIYLHTGNSDGETEYKITIPVMDRAEPTDIEPTPAQESTIGQLISALNDAVDAAEEAAAKGPKIVEDYWYIWDSTAGEYVNTDVKAEGVDGFTPVVEVLPASGGYMLRITNASGTTNVLVSNGVDGVDGNIIWWTQERITASGDNAAVSRRRLNGPDGLTPAVGDYVFGPAIGEEGEPTTLYVIISSTALVTMTALGRIVGQAGQDGYSPEVTITEITGGHRVTITDADHPNGQSFDVMDGQDAVVDATLSHAGEAADAAETGKVKELADAVAERVYDYSTSIDDNDITALRGKNITSAKNIEDNASYSVLYFTAPATGHYKVISTTSSQLNGYIYSSTSMSSATYVGFVPRDGTALTVDLEQGQVLGVRAKSTTFTISASYATTYTVEMKQSLPLTETMDGQIKTLLNFPDELQLPLSVAHRGLATNSASIIENTMPAYEDAVAKGWRYLETDIRFTSDDICVLLHDATIAAGVNISDITYTQALTYDLGGGTHIATLEELLQLCRKSHTYPVIEVKDSTISQTHVDIVWALLQKYEMEHECFFLCSSSGGVTPFLAKDPYVSTVMTGTSAWTVIDPAEFGEHPLSTTGKKWLSGKNKMFYEKETSAFADLAAQENFVDWCHYWGFYAGIYCPTTQASLDNKSKRFDMVTSQYYKYEVERSYGGGGGGAVDSVNGKTGAVVLNASDVGAGTYSKPSGGIPKTDLASDVQTSLGKADTALQPGDVPEPYFVTYSTSDMTTWTCDKTFAQIVAAFTAGKQIIIIASVSGVPAIQECSLVYDASSDLITAWIAWGIDTGYLLSHDSTDAISISSHALTESVAADQGSAHAGEFLVVGNDGIVTTMTLATWQGGSY